jgi:hypothetical protein
MQQFHAPCAAVCRMAAVVTGLRRWIISRMLWLPFGRASSLSQTLNPHFPPPISLNTNNNYDNRRRRRHRHTATREQHRMHATLTVNVQATYAWPLNAWRLFCSVCQIPHFPYCLCI